MIRISDTSKHSSHRFATRSLSVGALLTALIALSACSLLRSDETSGRAVEYRKSQTLPPLEVPPDLTSSTIDDTLAVPEIDPDSSATFSAYSGEREGPATGLSEAVLPRQGNISIERDGDQRWLVIGAPPAEVWEKVRQFWLDNGILLTEENPRIGIMETGWIENRADIPQDPIRNILGKVFDSVYSAGTRDQFRVRLERGREAGTTEVYLSHRGMQEVVQGDSTIWEARPSESELEAEMLNRLMSFFGVEEQKADVLLASEQSGRARAELTRNGEGQAMLTLEEEFSGAWRRTGLALDRVGFTVEDRNRSEGIYYVRYNDPLTGGSEGGFFSWLGFGDDDKPGDDKYLVSVEDNGPATRIAVLNEEGVWENTPTSEQILTLLHEELR